MISVVVLSKNEEKNIKDCLQSVAFADEILLIDDNSTDQTVAIARKMGARVYTHSLENNYSQQRNFGLEKAKGEWVLFLDADERIGHSLQYEMITAINEALNTTNGYYIKRFDTLWGKELKYGEVGNIALLRLGRKGKGVWKGTVHETWEIEGKKQMLSHHITHFPHQTIKEFLTEINYYTTLRAQELYSRRKRTNIFQILFFPKAKFIINYFFKLGILDGIPGLVVAVLMSFHSFLVRSKLWQLQQKKKGIRVLKK